MCNLSFLLRKLQYANYKEDGGKHIVIVCWGKLVKTNGQGRLILANCVC
jgi:hypothetical protein